MLFRDESRTIVISAPAKLNLFLKVLGKRSDGFHELETLMVSVGLYDTLRFTRTDSDDIQLCCHDVRSRKDSPLRKRGSDSGDVLPTDRANLVVRATELLRETTGVRLGVLIDLWKRIPLAAGLAGGSSDAAATLAGLNRLWNLGLARHELQSLAAKLGSDIPFFLNSSPAAVCRGRGEIIEPLRLPLGMHFVIVRPQTGLSTALVFQHCRPAADSCSVHHIVSSLKRGCLARTSKYLYNSLQEPAERLNAEVSRLHAAFSRLPFAGHMMSGSGTSYFGLCATRRQALHLSSRLKASRLGDVFVANSRP